MAARAMWKGVIRLGSQKVPVKLYSAVQDRDVHFTLLERSKHAPVEQKMIKPETEEPVEYAEVKKGFLADGSYVMLDQDELKKLAPKPSRDIEVSRFVARDQLGSEWFVRPYYLGPDGDEEGYLALNAVLKDADKNGVVHWVMRGIEYSGVLSANESQLLLTTLRHEDEVVSTDKINLPKGRDHTDKEAKMAEQLIEAFDDVFDPSIYHNEHRERVLDLIDKKSKGKRVRLKKVAKKRATPSLEDALSRSLLAVHKKSTKQTAAKPRTPRARKERHVA